MQRRMNKKEPKQIIDISLAIKEDMIVYPGNPVPRIQVVDGETSTHSILEFGTHTGTHIDAPRHVFAKGKGVEKIPLDIFMGVCRVLDLSKVEESIKVADLKKFRIKKNERILVKTRNSKKGFKKFYDTYIYLDGDAADYLAEQGIVLFGIDYLSVKKRGGKDQRPHTSLLKKGIVIFEGLDLSRVEAGNYTFVGLPLKVGNIDGAPARAVLVRN